MCTSFVIYSSNTFIGMNFDISKRPIKIVLKGDNQFVVLQQEDGQFLPAFGVNRNGTFVNLLMVQPNEEGKYRRGKNCVHIMRLFEEVLAEKTDVSQLKDYLNEKTIVNVPNYSVHSLIAGKNQNSYIVEPGRENLDIDSVKENFMVLTNFPLSENKSKNYEEVEGFGSDRYKKAYNLLLKNKDHFSDTIGFSILKETIQQDGDYPTQFSMISVPEESAVYFTLNGEFQKIFKFSFMDKVIRTNKGFHHNNEMPLSTKGVLLSELESW